MDAIKKDFPADELNYTADIQDFHNIIYKKSSSTAEIAFIGSQKDDTFQNLKKIKENHNINVFYPEGEKIFQYLIENLSDVEQLNLIINLNIIFIKGIIDAKRDVLCLSNLGACAGAFRDSNPDVRGAMNETAILLMAGYTTEIVNSNTETMDIEKADANPNEYYILLKSPVEVKKIILNSFLSNIDASNILRADKNIMLLLSKQKNFYNQKNGFSKNLNDFLLTTR